MGEFPSGQRGQTVNLLSLTSLVRIQLPPPKNTVHHPMYCVFSFGGGSCRFGAASRFACEVRTGSHTTPEGRGARTPDEGRGYIRRRRKPSFLQPLWSVFCLVGEAIASDLLLTSLIRHRRRKSTCGIKCFFKLNTPLPVG